MEIEATKKVIMVAKEEISNLKFPLEEVILDLEKRNDLKRELEKGLKLGNAYHGKVKILFEDSEGLKSVETTIWGITDKNILLKQTTLIPIRRVHGIKFY